MRTNFRFYIIPHRVTSLPVLYYYYIVTFLVYKHSWFLVKSVKLEVPLDGPFFSLPDFICSWYLMDKIQEKCAQTPERSSSKCKYAARKGELYFVRTNFRFYSISHHVHSLPMTSFRLEKLVARYAKMWYIPVILLTCVAFMLQNTFINVHVVNFILEMLIFMISILMKKSSTWNTLYFNDIHDMLTHIHTQNIYIHDIPTHEKSFTYTLYISFMIFMKYIYSYSKYSYSWYS